MAEETVETIVAQPLLPVFHDSHRKLSKQPMKNPT